MNAQRDAQCRLERGGSKWPSWSAGVSITASMVFVALLAALHVLRPDLAPSWRFISDYETGDYGWVMRAAFFSLAISCAAVVVALLPHARGIAGRVGLVLVCLSASGMILAGLYAPSTDNKLHEAGAMLDQLPLAALLIALSLWQNRRWRPARRALVGSTLVLLAGTVVFIASMAVMQPSRNGPASPEVLIGWPNRIFILAHGAWLIPTAWWAWRLEASRAMRPCQEGAAPTIVEQLAGGKVRHSSDAFAEVRSMRDTT